MPKRTLPRPITWPDIITILNQGKQEPHVRKEWVNRCLAEIANGELTQFSTLGNITPGSLPSLGLVAFQRADCAKKARTHAQAVANGEPSRYLSSGYGELGIALEQSPDEFLFYCDIRGRTIGYMLYIEASTSRLLGIIYCSYFSQPKFTGDARFKKWIIENGEERKVVNHQFDIPG